MENKVMSTSDDEEINKMTQIDPKRPDKKKLGLLFRRPSLTRKSIKTHRRLKSQEISPINESAELSNDRRKSMSDQNKQKSASCIFCKT